jgi:hypothetical protein
MIMLHFPAFFILGAGLNQPALSGFVALLSILLNKTSKDLG